MRRLYHNLKVGESLQVGDSTIKLEAKSGQLARLLIVTPEKTEQPKGAVEPFKIQRPPIK